jgi:hypothetical protein
MPELVNDNLVPTTAELFPDGGAIDLLCSGQLISLQAGREIIAPVIEHSGRRYCAAKLDPSLHAAVCLPAEAADYGTTDVLVEGMADSAREALGAPHNQALILATTLLSTSVAECLPGGAPTLNLWGPAEKRAAALAFVLTLCRRPLQLVGTPLERFAELPRGLCPTVIINDPSEPSIRKLLPAAGQGGARLLRGGRLLAAQCSFIVFTELPSATIQFRMPLSGLAPKRCFTPNDAAELANRFKGQLLRYRLARHCAIANSQFGTSGLSPGIARVAHTLGAAVEGAENLQSQVVKALQELDEDRKIESCQSEEAVAIEATLLPCHEQRPSALIRELSEIGNTILIERGERALFTPKKFGATLRRLELPTRRQAPGFELAFDSSTCRRIHELARILGVFPLLKPLESCSYCASFSGTETRV